MYSWLLYMLWSLTSFLGNDDGKKESEADSFLADKNETAGNAFFLNLYVLWVSVIGAQFHRNKCENCFINLKIWFK